MAVYQLDDDSIWFPDPEEADGEYDGLLAVGGDYRPERLLTAYASGIFPWPVETGKPITWFSPDPRFVLKAEDLHIPKSLVKTLRKGLFDDADGGTLFLDEIGETSERVQAMLLTVLETGMFVRVGGSEANRVKVDVRLVCATNRNLQQMVLEGEFRLDLYQRISEFPVQLTPLRDRKEDIEPLVRNFWHNMTGKMPTKKQIAALSAYDYPGNVRELIAILKQAKALGEDDFSKILAAHAEFNQVLLDGLRTNRDGALPSIGYPDNLDAAIRQHAKSVFDKFNQNLTVATKALGISVNTLKKYLADTHE